MLPQSLKELHIMGYKIASKYKSFKSYVAFYSSLASVGMYLKCLYICFFYENCVIIAPLGLISVLG